MNSGVSGLAFRTVTNFATTIEATLRGVPTVALEDPACDESVLDCLVDLIAVTTNVGRDARARRAGGLEAWPTGIGVSVATKLLHKKRPALLPIIDTQAIFEGYLALKDPGWENPGPSVRTALETIQADVTSPRNAAGWSQLESRWPWLTRIELFDIVWWEHDGPRRHLKQKRGAPFSCLLTNGQSCNGACPSR
jgi:hypothetical protein